MNIQYRILKIDTTSHGVLVRYFTDKVTEVDLATQLKPDGSPILTSDGYPLSTRTDVVLSLYQTPTPSADELDKMIMRNAPVDWLKLQEDIKDPEIDTEMVNIKDLIGNTKSFTESDIQAVIQDLAPEMGEETPNSMKIDNTFKAYNVVNGLIDSVKILSKEDPKVVKELIDTLNSIS